MMETDTRVEIPQGDCHYCGEPFSYRLLGAYGGEVWGFRHDGPTIQTHVPVTSDEVWADDEIDETSSPNYGLS